MNDPGDRTPGSGEEVRMAIEVKVPDIGDFKDVPVIEIHVKPGDSIKADDPLVTLESDKATMDVPSDRDGTVEAVLVKIGDRVGEGAPSSPCRSAPPMHR
jgi:pyruvate/2-oxoglutarate dehydrogenase complex dihydrolipoamide acyltransferase (E2) component